MNLPEYGQLMRLYGIFEVSDLKTDFVKESLKAMSEDALHT